MKIVLIHGQNHKGSSYHIGHMIAEKITGENEIKEILSAEGSESFLPWLL